MVELGRLCLCVSSQQRKESHKIIFIPFSACEIYSKAWAHHSTLEKRKVFAKKTEECLHTCTQTKMPIKALRSGGFSKKKKKSGHLPVSFRQRAKPESQSVRDLKSWPESNSPWLVLLHVPPGLILGAPDRMAQGKQNAPAAAETLHHLGRWEQRTRSKILSPLTEPSTFPSALGIPFLLFCSPPHLFILKK